MPFVTIKILTGQSQAQKDEMSRRVTDAISEVAQKPKDAIWIVFEDVTAEDWYVGATTVAALKKAGKL
jgi:4-oxalocrotonate tautomerase